jgi:hypothetical protein
VVRSVCGVKAGPHQLLAVNNQPAITNKRFILFYLYNIDTRALIGCFITQACFIVFNLLFVAFRDINLYHKTSKEG